MIIIKIQKDSGQKIFLVQNGIYQKYSGQSMFFGAHVPIGLPTSNEIPVEPQFVNEASRAKENQVWKQDFRYGRQKNNRILAYRFKNSTTLKTYYVLGSVANIYFNNGSQTSLGLPTEDTIGLYGVKNCKQSMEFIEINICVRKFLEAQGVDITVEGNADKGFPVWKEYELKEIKDSLDKIPDHIADASRLNLKKQAIIPDTICNNNPSFAAYYSYTEDPYGITIYDRGDLPPGWIEQYFIHEMAHRYQMRIYFDPNLDSSKIQDHIEILFEPTVPDDLYGNYWEVDPELINEDYFNETENQRIRCLNYQSTVDVYVKPNQQVFSSSYGCSTYKNEKGYAESIAEDVRIFYFNREALKRLDDVYYLYDEAGWNGSTKIIDVDLNRHDYISNNYSIK